MKQVGIITEDIVFYSIIVTLMRRFDKSLSVEHFSSYKTILDSKTLDKKDVFIIDGIMSGTASGRGRQCHHPAGRCLAEAVFLPLPGEVDQPLPDPWMNIPYR